MNRIGIDAGASSVKLVLTDENGTLRYSVCRLHHGKSKEVLLELLCKLAETFAIEPDEAVKYAVCGQLSHLMGSPDGHENETDMLIRAARNLYPQAASIISLGSQKTAYIRLNSGKAPDISRSGNCSSGTGAFFEEQAGKLGIAVEEISDLVRQADEVPFIAGRCSVFSKTDMIHKMQEGVSMPNLLNGLCHALARNFKSTVLRNQPVETPVLLCGGVMKNAGATAALKEQLKLNDADLVSCSDPSILQAFGCALTARREIEWSDLLASVQQTETAARQTSLAPLADYALPEDRKADPVCSLIPGNYYLGIDIGSTSINLVLIDQTYKVYDLRYVRNTGNSLSVVKDEIEALNRRLPEDVRIVKTAVTGSGREQIAAAIGADLAINEITAQTAGAVLHWPDADTVFEIGGQDSKYMSVKDGRMQDFEMNKVCAAGTGAFLEEQIRKLGISMEEFLDLAMKSKNPCEIGSRCTVFIESSIVKAVSEGNPLEDICAGLAYAIASNYLYRVVGQKPVGEKIALQGGIAFNEAVVCAFRALTGKKIVLSPYFHVTGALGAAVLLLEHNGISFDREKNQKLNAILNEQSEKSYLMDYAPPAKNGRKVIGIPRVLFLHKMFPLFQTLFKSLGFEVLLSPLSSSETVAKAQQYAAAETCYPVKLICGHIAWLMEQGVDFILLPRLYTIKHEGSAARQDYACLYMQTAPLLMEQAFHFKERGIKLLMPELSLNFGKKYMVESLLSMAEALGVSKAKMLAAAIKGFAALVSHTKRLEKLAEGILDTEEPVFVIVSRLYNIVDPVLNMGIEEHLNKAGCRVIHLEHLQASHMCVEHDYDGLCWPFGQHILTGLNIIKKHKNLYPVYITNHGCGPDTALQHFFQKEMEGREYLHLEVDEHASKVGIMTRLEAFLYSIRPQQTASLCQAEKPAWQPEQILIPNFGVYTDLIERFLPAGHPPVLKVKPLIRHRSFCYAMNKEYHSLLVMLEEVLNTVKQGVKYELVCPMDEGSEVFGQYALLLTQALQKRGYEIRLKSFYIEDMIRRKDHLDIFRAMIEAELEEDAKRTVKEKRAYLLGEPLAVHMKSIGRQGIGRLYDSSAKFPMSEALLFHMTEIDRRGEYKRQRKEWKKLHDEAMKKSRLYSDLNTMRQACAGRLDFIAGNMAKYRFGKLMTLKNDQADGVILLHSAEENAAVILKILTEKYKDALPLPVLACDLDREHRMGEDELALFMNWL